MNDKTKIDAELLPCPFCNCNDLGEVTVNDSLASRHRRFKVYCKGCQIRTSEQKTRKAARQQWNARYSLPVDGSKIPAALINALKFYADGDHFLLADPDAWDSCSGEPMNFQHDEAGTASVEDGSIAKAALEGLNSVPVDGVVVPRELLAAALSYPVTPDDMLKKIKATEELRALLASHEQQEGE